MGDEGEAAELRRRLWNADESAWSDADRATVVEQYRLYVEMADRISQRRALANTFFLTLNTALLSFGALPLLDGSVDAVGALPAIVLVALLAECFAWYSLVRSYRLLNGAKYRVIGALEERLPASPYWNAEWWALGEGKDRRKYWPLSHIEQGVPVVFAIAYVATFIAVAAQ